MKRKKAAIIAFGNIGKAVYNALKLSEDFYISTIFVRNNISDNYDMSGIKVVNDLDKVDADVAIITAPSRTVKDIAVQLLQRGINCVDCFDIHSDIVETKKQLDIIAKQNNAVSVCAAGWDPGTDSVIRTLLLAMAPRGITYTNFGPGVSMGHTVCVKSKNGVKDALSLTFPQGEGLHRRIVYVVLNDGYNLKKVSEDIKADPYFANDETHVFAVDDTDALKDLGHGVTIVRKGSSGNAQNQLFNFDMRIDNPALTAQVLVACARAATRQLPGCYTMPEIPPLDYLYGDRDELIQKLV